MPSNRTAAEHKRYLDDAERLADDAERLCDRAEFALVTAQPVLDMAEEWLSLTPPGDETIGGAMPLGAARSAARDALDRVLKRAFLSAEMTDQMLELSPSWLRLTPAELSRVADMVEELLIEHPAATPAELLWCLAAQSVRPRKRGQKPKWQGPIGIALVGEVEATMALHGLNRTNEKGLRRAIAIVKTSAPARYGAYSEERLRKAYYEALPAYAALAHCQSGKPAE